MADTISELKKDIEGSAPKAYSFVATATVAYSITLYYSITLEYSVLYHVVYSELCRRHNTQSRRVTIRGGGRPAVGSLKVCA